MLAYMRFTLLQLCLISLIIIFCMVTAAKSGEDRGYLLATANTAGTYYPVGVALATLTKVKLEPEHKFSLTAIRTAGSAENLDLLRDKKADFAILQGLYGYWSWNGIGRFRENGPQEHLRSITMLWQNVEHFIMKSDYLKNGTIDDLRGIKGRKFSIGKRDSGSAGSGLHILEGVGLDPGSRFQLVHLSYSESSDAIQAGAIQGMNIPGGPPVEAVERTFDALGKDVTILEFTDDQVAKANSRHKLWSRYTIPPNTYPGQDKPVHTIAQPNFLAVRSDVSDEDVYLIVQTMYNNLPFLHSIHPITRAMKMEAAITGLPVPLHPGAARFYRENGIEIPDELIRP